MKDEQNDPNSLIFKMIVNILEQTQEFAELKRSKSANSDVTIRKGKMPFFGSRGKDRLHNLKN